MGKQAQKFDQDDPRQTVLAHRCRELGLRPTTANLIAAATQMAGSHAGRAFVRGMDVDTAHKAWNAWTGLTGAEERFHRQVLGMTMHPEVANMEIAPEPFEVDADSECDTRSDDEKERDARNSWARWRDYQNGLPIADQAIIESVKRGWVRPVIDGKLTDKGRLFCDAMRMLVEVVERC